MKTWMTSQACHCVVKLQICSILKDLATEVWKEAQDVPYAHKENQWVGIKSFHIKVREPHRMFIYREIYIWKANLLAVV